MSEGADHTSLTDGATGHHTKINYITYLEDVDKLRVGDVTVLVLIKVVEDDAKLLSGEEDSKLRHELFELKLLEDAVLIAVEALHTE